MGSVSWPDCTTGLHHPHIWGVPKWGLCKAASVHISRLCREAELSARPSQESTLGLGEGHSGVSFSFLLQLLSWSLPHLEKGIAGHLMEPKIIAALSLLAFVKGNACSGELKASFLPSAAQPGLAREARGPGWALGEESPLKLGAELCAHPSPMLAWTTGHCPAGNLGIPPGSLWSFVPGNLPETF